MKKALITGISGQDGSYLTELLLEKGYEVHGMVRRNSSLTRERLDPIRANNPKAPDNLNLHYGDMSDGSGLHLLLERIRPDEIYNLASQSHVKVSFEQPDYTADINANGTIRLLEANRQTGLMARFYQASSSEMFGCPINSPQNETTPLRPVTPYGAAKAFAHQMCVINREAYGMFVCCGILYNHESPRRGEHFVTRKICRSAARIANGLQQHVELGDLEAQRDWGYAPEYVDAMWRMLQLDKAGDYVIATGILHTVREILEIAFSQVGLKYTEYIVENKEQFRPAGSNLLKGDSKKAGTDLGWKAKTLFKDLIITMVEAELKKIK